MSSPIGQPIQCEVRFENDEEFISASYLKVEKNNLTVEKTSDAAKKCLNKGSDLSLDSARSASQKPIEDCFKKICEDSIYPNCIDNIMKQQNGVCAVAAAWPYLLCGGIIHSPSDKVVIENSKVSAHKSNDIAVNSAVSGSVAAYDQLKQSSDQSNSVSFSALNYISSFFK